MLFTIFFKGFLSGIIILISILFLKKIVNYIQVNGQDSWVGISILIFLLALFTSCSKEDVELELCGDCIVRFDVPFEQDSNGYYLANLSYNSSGAARFNIDTYATVIDGYTYSIFNGNIDIEGYENTYVVQNSRLDHNDQGFTRRIVGPVLTKFIGDTLVVDVETYWEGNKSWEVSKNTLKFIIK